MHVTTGAGCGLDMQHHVIQAPCRAPHPLWLNHSGLCLFDFPCFYILRLTVNVFPAYTLNWKMTMQKLALLAFPSQLHPFLLSPAHRLRFPSVPQIYRHSCQCTIKCRNVTYQSTHK